MNFKEKTLNKNYIYKGAILNLRRDEVLLPDGRNAFREIVEHSGGSAILCEKDDKILLVKQFRYPYKQEIFELPAGKINIGEDPMETARRELLEEGGINATKLELMFTIYPTPGYTEEKIYLYRAVQIEEKTQRLDDGEFLTCYWFTKDELKKMIEDKEICDAKTLIALLKIL